ncbi:hypothetical protein ACHAWX_006652 [Stephanocyclus meneghinianus]
MHDSTAGWMITTEKEKIAQEIEAQIELGGEDLTEQDQRMLKVNLRDLSKSSGQEEAYWLLAIKLPGKDNRCKVINTITDSIVGFSSVFPGANPGRRVSTTLMWFRPQCFGQSRPGLMKTP